MSSARGVKSTVEFISKDSGARDTYPVSTPNGEVQTSVDESLTFT